MKFRDALNLFLRPLNVELTKIDWGRDWLRDTESLLGKNRSTCIIDAGAHRGETLEKLIPRFPDSRVHAFEPFPEAFDQLKQAWEHHPQVTLHSIALGPEDGSTRLHLNGESATNSLLEGNRDCADISPTGQSLTIRQTRIDSFLDSGGIDHVDLLKLDCQGYENRILQGAGQSLRDKKITLIYTEVLLTPQYEGQCYFEELAAELRKYDYHLVALYDGRRDPSGQLLWTNALFKATASRGGSK